MGISIKEYVDDLNEKITELMTKQNVLKLQIAEVAPLRKELSILEGQQFALQGALENLKPLIELEPEVQEALHPADPFGEAVSES